MISLAKSLGWPFETYQLVHNPLNLIPNLLLGATDVTLNKKKSAPLKPPWPDLVIAASRRSTPVALWIREQSGGRTKLVHLLHVQAPLSWFDLIITTPQYRIPERANVLHNTGPLNQISLSSEMQTEAWRQRFKDLPRPYTLMLVGGNSSSYDFDSATAKRLGQAASREVMQRGGAMLVSNSPRTPASSSDALQQALECPHYFYRWKPNDKDNPYSIFLTLADDLIVTADSASLLAEACQTGKPVQVFEWETKNRNARHSHQSASKSKDKFLAKIRTRIFEALVYYGLLKPRRDFAAYHEAFMARGLVTVLGSSPQSIKRQPLDDMQRAIKRIHALFNDHTISNQRIKSHD